MDDMISRQAAIDASCTCHGGKHCNHYPCKDVQAIMDLPSVQIVHCKHCRHYTTASNGCNGMCDIQLTMVMYPWDYCSYGERRDG